MKKHNCRISTKIVFNMIIFLAVIFLAQMGQASGESLQTKKINCDYEELLKIVNMSNDRIKYLESEQSKIPRLVKTAIDNILTTVIERKVKGLETELKDELNTLEADLKDEFDLQLGSLDADVAERMKIIEDNTGEALNNLSDSLKDEIIVQFLGRDMKIAASLAQLKKELKKMDSGAMALHTTSDDADLNEKGSGLNSDESLLYGYQANPQEESRKNLLLISQMFGYLDEKDREIASLSERLKSLEAIANERINPTMASQNRMTE